MAIDRNSPVHLYIQIADSIRDWIATGAYAPGASLPTEEELCKLFGVSRFPMRQAMAMLMEERLICRARGKGTFVSGGGRRVGIPPVQTAAPVITAAAAARPRTCALVLPGIGSDLTADMLRGFERAAFERGYATLIALAGGSVSEEAAVEHVVANGASGVVIFPKNNTLLNEDMLSGWLNRGVYISLIDRNPGLEHFDYVGSDNFGGGYMAAHHMHLNGYQAALFVAEQYAVSSVQERCAGFNRGLQRFEMRALSAECGGAENYAEFGDFISSLQRLRAHVPFGVFAENDELAEKVMATLAENGFSVGDEVGVIGFDDSTLCRYLNPRLTSVAQNGYLIGETAARLAIEKAESGSRQSVRHILPTQLAARRSCGEGRPEQG